jgi:eukaryotic-like serine/threonine-protein kinase
MLRMERGGAWLIVGDRIGEGGQGVVHRARLNGVPFAVKWYRPGPAGSGARKAISALVGRGGPPHPAFVWPIDLVTSDRLPGFGYVMPLLEPRFASLARLLDEESQPSFRVMAHIGVNLVDAFAALHASGLCYRDISFGNLRADPLAREVAIIDVDNIGIDGAPALVKGTALFMAPEIHRDEALPSTVTDLHSLAVLLFFLFMHDHPLLGSRADSSYGWDGARVPEAEIMVHNLGLNPLFVFDPDDPTNAPVKDSPMLTWWPIYPQDFRRVFTRAFTTGLHDATLQGRVTDGTWRRALLRLSDCEWECPHCRAAVLYDSEQPAQPCWDCHTVLPAPPRLSLPGGTLVLAEGAIVTGHHLHRDRDYRTEQATVERHPSRAGDLVLRNLTQTPWRVIPDGQEPKTVAPGQRLAVRPMQIELDGVHGRILPWESLPDLTTARARCPSRPFLTASGAASCHNAAGRTGSRTSRARPVVHGPHEADRTPR